MLTSLFHSHLAYQSKLVQSIPDHMRLLDQLRCKAMSENEGLCEGSNKSRQTQGKSRRGWSVVLHAQIAHQMKSIVVTF